MYNAMLKKNEVHVGGATFYVAPFPVFTSARITAMLAKVVSPVIGSIIVLLGGDEEGMEEDYVTASDLDSAMQAFASAIGTLNPADFERLMRELLVNSRNIVWANEENRDGEILTEDDLNALFAGDVQNMYILAYHVLKTNFRGFFEKFKSLSGSRMAEALKGKIGLDGTGNSIPAGSAI